MYFGVRGKRAVASNAPGDHACGGVCRTPRHRWLRPAAGPATGDHTCGRTCRRCNGLCSIEGMSMLLRGTAIGPSQRCIHKGVFVVAIMHMMRIELCENTLFAGEMQQISICQCKHSVHLCVYASAAP